MRAEDAAEERRDAEVVTDEARGGTVFIAEDGERATAGMERAQQFAGAGHQFDTLEHGPIPIVAVDAQRPGQIGFAHEPAHGVLQATPDGAPDLFAGRRGQPELRQRVRIAAMDRGQVIHQRAVEIKQNRPEAHAGQSLSARLAE